MEKLRAVPMSYILNQSGPIIPAMPGKYKKGVSHRNHFYKVTEVIAFLKLRWGAPELVAYPPSGGGILARRKEIILFDVHGWRDASGHAALFNESGAPHRSSKLLSTPMRIILGCAVFLLGLSSPAIAGRSTITAISRTNAQNYKDRALASCISTAYKGSSAGEDADITTSAFLEWTDYVGEKGSAATDQLVEKYLRRDYNNPIEGYAGAKFNLLKCLDMYHSPELEAQVRKYVPHPDWVGDKPPKRKRK